jgi:hypothetical protein
MAPKIVLDGPKMKFLLQAHFPNPSTLMQSLANWKLLSFNKKLGTISFGFLHVAKVHAKKVSCGYCKE